MHWLDIVIIVSIIIPILIGLKIGIIKMIIAFVGLIIAVVLASNYYGALARVLGMTENQQADARALAQHAHKIFGDLGAQLDMQEVEELLTALSD